MAEDYQSLPFYHSAAWHRIRKIALQRDGGMCQKCMERMQAGYGFHPNRAQMVHHIIPVKERPDLALELSNLRSLCNSCHAEEHPEKRTGKRTPEKTAPGKMRIIRV